MDRARGDVVPLECPLDMGTDQSMGHYCIVELAAGLGLFHLLSCLQVPVLRESSIHAGCFLGQEKPSSEYREGALLL